MFSVERGLSQGDFISGGHVSERLYVPELVINDWGNWTNMNVPMKGKKTVTLMVDYLRGGL